jgi:hypothetical protein
MGRFWSNASGIERVRSALALLSWAIDTNVAIGMGVLSDREQKVSAWDGPRVAAESS